MNPRPLLVRVARALPQLLVLGLLGLGSGPATAGPAMADPKPMSGMPRPDPQIPAGELTVRVLLGGFDAPALDATVELELRSADGRTAELRSEVTGNQGRAHFRDLGAYAGGAAVARVVLDGETIRSQQIDLRPDVGTAVMLVKGAPKRPGTTQEISLPGIVFDFDKTPVGSLMVGVFDLKERQGLGGMDVELLVTSADGQTETRTLKTEPMGQVTFDGLDALPAGTTLQIRAQLDPEGEPYRSMVFTPSPGKGQAIVLARGRMSTAGGNPHAEPTAAPASAPTRPQPLPPPQVAPMLPVGTVHVRLVDGTDRPVADQAIEIVKKDFSGTEERFSATTDERGVASMSELPVVNDALYYVGVTYDEAPYTSGFFGLDKRGGVSVAMRVWPVTDDRSVVQSAVQFEIIEGENDTAQIIQVYEVLVGGEQAYWPGAPGLRIEGIPGAKGMVVLRGAEEWLEHEEKAPFATLAGPIPPGEVVGLSVGYIIDGHGGRVDLDWTPPFQLIESALVLSEDLDVDASGAKKDDRKIPERPGLDYTPVAYDLGQQGVGAVQATITGLRQTDKRFGWIAMGVGALLSLVVAVGIMLRPKGDARARLLRRRDELLAALSRTHDDAQRRRMVTVLDRIYRQLDALEELKERRSGAAKAG